MNGIMIEASANTPIDHQDILLVKSCAERVLLNMERHIKNKDIQPENLLEGQSYVTSLIESCDDMLAN